MKDVYTIPDLVKRWQVSRHTIATAIREGRLRAFKVGQRVYRIRREEVLRYEQLEQEEVARAS